MPLYTLVCNKCEKTEEIIRTMQEAGTPYFCQCGEQMRRDFHADVPNSGDKEYGKAIVSDSLAVSMSQIEEHKRMFPDVRITPQGQPVFESYKQHDNYLKKCGFRKERQKVKRNRKRIA